MNRDEETRILRLLGWTNVLSLLIVGGVVLYALSLEPENLGDRTTPGAIRLLFIVFVIGASAGLIHWLRLRWKGD